MTLGLVIGSLVAIYGAGETVWAVLSNMPRWMVAQGTFFLELGLSFVFLEILPEGTMRSTLAGAFAVSALVSALFQHKLMRAARAASKPAA